MDIAWHIHFAEVFISSRRHRQVDRNIADIGNLQITTFEPGGFDIVLANPPYGLVNKRQNKQVGYSIHPKILEALKTSREFKSILKGMTNIFSLFIRRSFSLLAPKGLFVEIFPLSFTCDLSFANLRKYILGEQNILRIDAFPERDDPKRRVFESAKMSVCIIVAQRDHMNIPFPLRVHSVPFVDNTEAAIIHTSDIDLLDSNSSIPLVSQSDISRLKNIYSCSIRLGQIARCCTGEVDLTLCKRYIRKDSRYSTMYKGAIIDRYRIKETMSQGEIEYLDSENFLNAKGKRKDSAAWHHKQTRIVLQGITGVNERIRLKMTLIQPNVFLANSANYILLNHDNIADCHYILGVLNSHFVNYVFKCFSTNSNVNGYEVDNLPIPNASDKDKQQITCLVKKCLDANGIGCETWEKEIDDIVYN